ncbi:hypothetical protein JZ751_003098, partial [Albula glossodonta]
MLLISGEATRFRQVLDSNDTIRLSCFLGGVKEPSRGKDPGGNARSEEPAVFLETLQMQNKLFYLLYAASPALLPRLPGNHLQVCFLGRLQVCRLLLSKVLKLSRPLTTPNAAAGRRRTQHVPHETFKAICGDQFIPSEEGSHGNKWRDQRERLLLEVLIRTSRRERLARRDSTPVLRESDT